MNPAAVPSNVWCGLPCEVDDLIRVNVSNGFVFRNKKMGMVPVIGPIFFAHPSECEKVCVRYRPLNFEAIPVRILRN